MPLLDWLMGQIMPRTDIELPSEGKVDPRLPKDKRNVASKTLAAFSDFNKVGEPDKNDQKVRRKK